MQLKKQRIRDAVQAAIDELLKNDTKLLLLNVNERTITQRLALYLQKRFPQWNVDCEYNRIRERVKEVFVRGEYIKVVPDVIVHHRDTWENLIAIEAKKSGDVAADEFDREKLRALREQLGYEVVAFLKFKTGAAPGLEALEWL